MITNSRFHRRGDAQRSVKLAEVVEAKVERNRGLVVLKLLAEAIRQAGEAADLHPHRQILPFDMAGANPLRVGISTDHYWYSLHDIRRRVALFALARSRINFDELGEIATIQEHLIHGGDVRLEAIRGELESNVGRGHAPDLAGQFHGVVQRTPPTNESQDQFGGPVQSHPVVAISDLIVVRVFRAFVLLFAVDEIPHFIHLHIRCGNVAERVHELLAASARDQQEIDDGVAADSSEAFHRPNGATLHEHPDCHLAARVLEVIFDPEASLMSFREGLFAGEATETLEAIPVATEPLGYVATSRATHRSRFSFCRFHTLIPQQLAAVCQQARRYFTELYLVCFE